MCTSSSLPFSQEPIFELINGHYLLVVYDLLASWVGEEVGLIRHEDDKNYMPKLKGFKSGKTKSKRKKRKG